MSLRKRFRAFACAVLGFTLVTGCPTSDPTPSPLPDSRFYPTNCYPYVASNRTIQSYITATNQSLQWGMDLKVTFRDTSGVVVSTFQTRLNTGASHRISAPLAFEGSAVVEGVGAQYSLASQVELRALDDQGAALAAPAYDPQPSTMVLWPSVVDTPSGPSQTRVATLNFHADIPLYIEFDHLADEECGDKFWAMINPLAMHTFYPAQMFQEGVADGIQDFQVYGGGWTGPNRTGTADGAFMSALVATGANGRMALDNYAEIWNSIWPPYWPSDAPPDLYLADVQDDGVNRADRLHVKVFLGASFGVTGYLLHFYDEDGGETVKELLLVRHWEHPESLVTFRPMELLGRPFKGSVWVESQDPMKAAIRRVAPGKWADLSTAGPVGANRRCILPYVSSKDEDWKYEIVLFYPEELYPPPDPLAEPPPPITHGGPTDSAPPADERVVLRFYDMTGDYRGWVAVYMLENQTKRLTLAEVATYLQAPFEGSVQIEPFVAVEVEMGHMNGQAHASMNPWLTGQS